MEVSVVKPSVCQVTNLISSFIISGVAAGPESARPPPVIQLIIFVITSYRPPAVFSVINLNKVVERQFSVVRNVELMTAKTVIF